MTTIAVCISLAFSGHACTAPYHDDRGGHALPETNVQIGQRLAADQGWTGGAWDCLYRLWSRESGWDVTKSNYGGSGAYGIPQSLPGSKMASAGADWLTNAATQIRWGIGYVRARWGDPCSALQNSTDRGWY